MTDTITTAEVAAGGGGFAAVWVAARWLLTFMIGRHDKRERELDAREAADVKRTAERVAALEARQKQLEDEQRRSSVVIGILIAKVARDDPGAPELVQVRKILSEAFPIDLATPAPLQASLDRIP